MSKNSASPSPLENFGKGVYEQLKSGVLSFGKVKKLINRGGVPGQGKAYEAEKEKGGVYVIVGSFKASKKKNPRYFIELKLEKEGLVRRTVVSGFYARKAYNRLENPPQGRQPKISLEDINIFSEALGL